MGAESKIEWTDATWPVVQGCDYESPGCANCYAVPLLHRLSHNPNGKVSLPLAGLVKKAEDGQLRWTGKVSLREDRLCDPLSWSKPRMVFVPSHGDLFHKDVPVWFLDTVFATMALASWHTMQLLTKRAAWMREYLSDPDTPHRIAGKIETFPPFQLYGSAEGRAAAAVQLRQPIDLGGGQQIARRWPLPNVWVGVSVEDQERAVERVPQLLHTPAAIRFLSCEPLLGPVDLTRLWLSDRSGWWEPLSGRLVCKAVGENGQEFWAEPVEPITGRLHWVIAGGESGPGARPMHPDWALSLLGQCKAAGVPFFFKQWGEWLPNDHMERDERVVANSAGKEWHTFKDSESFGAYRVGKKAAGRLLDGRTWDEFPEVPHA